MVLFYRQGQAVADGARLLDLEEDTVKQRLSRARSMLRDELPALKPSSAVAATVTRVCLLLRDGVVQRVHCSHV